MFKKDSKSKTGEVQFLMFWTALVVCYVFIEWIFNQHLLQVMNLDSIDVEDFNITILFGKLTLSVGLNLLIKGVYRYRQWWKFLGGTIIGFLILTILYGEAVEEFPPELRYASNYGMISKKEVMSLKDEEKILDIKKEDGWHVRPMLLGHFMFTLDNKKWLEFQNRVTEPVTRELSAFIKNKNRNFDSYEIAENNRKELEKKWLNVLDAKTKYEEVRYSKAKRPQKKAALDVFRKKTGMEPSTTHEEFLKENNKDLNRALAVQIFPGYADAHISPIYVRNIPQNLNKEKFLEYIDNNVKEIKSQLTPSMKEIRNARKSPAIVKLLALPPIMIAMSLISIILNLLMIIGMWVNHIGNNSGFSSKTIMPIYFALTFFLLSLLVILKPPVTAEYEYWNNAEKKLSIKYPGLAMFWKIGLKLEPLVCFTKEEPKFIVELTKNIYK